MIYITLPTVLYIYDYNLDYAATQRQPRVTTCHDVTISEESSQSAVSDAGLFEIEAGEGGSEEIITNKRELCYSAVLHSNGFIFTFNQRY